MSFADYKKSRTNDLNALVEAAKRKGSGFGEEGYWQPKINKDGTGTAEVRFLPARIDLNDDLPWVQYFIYNFKGPTGQRYSERSLASIGEDDPVGEWVSSLWATKDKKDEAIAKKHKRKLKYVVNVYIVKDPANPENEGKVFRWKIGPQIMSMITDAMQPEFEDMKPIKVFDLWEGANFKLRVYKDGDWPAYDKSSFLEPGPLADDETLEKIWNQIQPLAPIVARDQFKSYEVLKAKFQKVMNFGGTRAAPADVKVPPNTDWDDDDDDEDSADEPEAGAAPKANEGEDPLSFFQRMANGG